MTKKHFIALAKELAGKNPKNDPYYDGTDEALIGMYGQWIADINGIADVCKQFNPAFDREKFIGACKGEN